MIYQKKILGFIPVRSLIRLIDSGNKVKQRFCMLLRKNVKGLRNPLLKHELIVSFIFFPFHHNGEAFHHDLVNKAHSFVTYPKGIP